MFVLQQAVLERRWPVVGEALWLRGALVPEQPQTCNTRFRPSKLVSRATDGHIVVDLIFFTCCSCKMAPVLLSRHQTAAKACRNSSSRSRVVACNAVHDIGSVDKIKMAGAAFLSSLMLCGCVADALLEEMAAFQPFTAGWQIFRPHKRCNGSCKCARPHKS